MSNLSFKRNGRGPALVLVHGYLGACAVWAQQAAHFSASYDVICPDLAGFGESAHLAATDSIEGHTWSVLAMLDDLQIETFDLLGHSMGGMIVQAMVKLAPQRVSKLVLYGTGPLGVLPGRFETIATSRAPVVRWRRRIGATDRGKLVFAGRAGRSLCHVCHNRQANQPAGSACQFEGLGKLGRSRRSGAYRMPNLGAVGKPRQILPVVAARGFVARYFRC